MTVAVIMAYIYIVVYIVTYPLLTAPDNVKIHCSLGDDGMASHLDYCAFTCDDGYKRKHDTT